MNLKDLEIVTLNADNIRHAFQLYKKGLNGSHSFEQFVKKYNTEHCGVAQSSQVAYFKNIPIAFYGVIPSIFQEKGKLFHVAQACDFITVKEFRGKGVNYWLGKKSNEKLKDQNCHFVFAFHSNASYFACKKLDWHIADKNLFRFHIPLTHNKIKINLLNKLHGNDGRVSKIKKVFSEFIDPERKFQNILNLEPGISCEYSPQYIEYKTFSPNYIIELERVRFWIKPKNYLDIGAINFQNEKDIEIALNCLKLLAKQLPVNEIIINAPYGSNLFNRLKKIYKPTPLWPMGYYNFSNEYDGAKILCNTADFDTF